MRGAGGLHQPSMACLARSRRMSGRRCHFRIAPDPWTDNGIKVFSGDGFKLTDKRELAIEKEIFALLQDPASADDTRSKFLAHRCPAKRNCATPTSKTAAASNRT